VKIDKIDGLLWTKLLLTSSIYLEERKQSVDELNVFPVPDGDTGTNMSLTIASSAKIVTENSEGNLSDVTKLMSHGALMGARGNSGVILSQLLAGFTKSVEGKDEINTREFCEALSMAVETAYLAVTNPVEGTILTVSKEASQAAWDEFNKDPGTINSVFEAAYRGACVGLQKTPSMLPVLEQAGVVDAGGQGLVYIFEGMLAVLNGDASEFKKVNASTVSVEKKEADYTKTEVLTYQYCTEFILKKRDKILSLDEIKSFLCDKGDCLLVVGNTDTCKIHIHTNIPGIVLNYCTDLGTLHKIQIGNMSEQSEEMRNKSRETKHLGIITVSFGTGLNEVFKSLGVDYVITGGQTMNPSTQDFIEAIDQLMTEEVLILPNNSNIILAAQQAVKVASKSTKVVATKSIPQGIAALMAFNAESDIQTNKEKMEEASKQVVTLEVTYSVRDAQYDGHSIKKGQILGIGEGKLIVTGSQVEDVVVKTLSYYLQSKYELVTVYYGEEIKEEEAEKMVEMLAQRYPRIDFELHYGGQPLYYYLISVE